MTSTARAITTSTSGKFCVQFCSGPYLQVLVRPSGLRKLQDSIADPKYDGIKTSRKQLMEHEDSDYDSEGDDDKTGSELGRDEDEEESDNNVPSFQSELESEPDAPTSFSTTFAAKSTTSYEEPKHTENPSSRLREARDEDRKKGKAVSKQIVRLIVLFMSVLLIAF